MNNKKGQTLKMKKEKSKTRQKEKNHPRQNLPAKKLVTNVKYADLLGLAIIILLGIIIYSNSFSCSFQFDDIPNIVDNANIRNLSDVNAIWVNSQTRFVPYYTFAINYHFGEYNVWGYHLVNLIIHLVNACIVYWLTVLIFSSPAMKGHPVTRHKEFIAFSTALLFVSHPLATQSVTYIIQRMASLAAMFYLFALALYVKGRLSDKNNLFKAMLFAGALISSVLAMLSKENAFSLPFAIILFEVFFLQPKKLIVNFKDYRIIIIIAAFLSFIIFVYFKFSLSIFMPISPNQINTFTITSLNYLFTQFSVIIKYIQLLFLPLNQNVDYDFPVSNNFFDIRTLLSFLMLLGLISLAIYIYKKNRIISFGISWFFLTILIESSIIPINDVIFEHRTYLPSYGFFLILSSCIYVLFWNKFKYIAISILVIIIGSNSLLTYKRNTVWKDNYTLWNDAISKSPNKARPYGNRSYAYVQVKEWDKVIVDCTKAIGLNQIYALAYFNRGFAYGNMGQRDKAIADYTKAIASDSKYVQAYSNRGVQYGDLVQWDKAISDYNMALKIDPKFAKAYSNRGLANWNLGNKDMAITDYSKAIELNPKYALAYCNRGIAYSNLNQPDLAIADLTKATEIDSRYAIAYFRRGIIYGNLKLWDKAITDFTKAVEIDPQYAEAYYNRGNTYGNLEQKQKAIADFSRAIEINPKYAEAYYNRGNTYGSLGQWDRAINDFTKAIEIDPKFTNAYTNRDRAFQKLNSKKK